MTQKQCRCYSTNFKTTQLQKEEEKKKKNSSLTMGYLRLLVLHLFSRQFFLKACFSFFFSSQFMHRYYSVSYRRWEADDQPTSSTSTLDTSGSFSAWPFLCFFFSFPPPASSPATAALSLFWLWDFRALRTSRWALLLWLTGPPKQPAFCKWFIVVTPM